MSRTGPKITDETKFVHLYKVNPHGGSRRRYLLNVWRRKMKSFTTTSQSSGSSSVEYVTYNGRIIYGKESKTFCPGFPFPQFFFCQRHCNLRRRFSDERWVHTVPSRDRITEGGSRGLECHSN